MCCRYLFADKASDYIKKNKVTREQGLDNVNSGDIHPSEFGAILYGKNHELVVTSMKWGFPIIIPSTTQKQLLINARAESILDKKNFADSAWERRCIIIADKFYEWNKEKEKNTFSLFSESPIFMAGIYKFFDGIPCFNILTTEANESMLPVHDRMPLILSEELIDSWIFDKKNFIELLNAKQPQLTRMQEYEQLSFF